MIGLGLRRALGAAALIFLPMTAFAAPIVITDQMDSSATYMRGDYAGYSSSNFRQPCGWRTSLGRRTFQPLPSLRHVSNHSRPR